ncbi:hypothetical protein AJ81_07375 [Pseudothermotoga hypogea DSM 11164 = NBRC 106472]|uniref:Uncharacterized protein n=1 Tax=Pseudothermotoga hypogea DSM 11164 = NBRC 106472 TaxID=1123384 RepID=A0A0X1KU42_9THEM|nr:hypothetical protein AJ81_07375 [Pseudothermotoga hypogea DSM 11164 = NBRC 106472]
MRDHLNEIIQKNGAILPRLVEPMGFEPTTSTLRR